MIFRLLHTLLQIPSAPLFLFLLTLVLFLLLHIALDRHSHQLAVHAYLYVAVMIGRSQLRIVVVVSFWGISQHCCNDKPFSALWPMELSPQTHSSRVIPDEGSLQQERRRCSGFIATNSHFPLLADLQPVAKDGSANSNFFSCLHPNLPFKLTRSMTQTRFFSFQNFMAPVKVIQAYVQVSVVWR